LKKGIVDNFEKTWKSYDEWFDGHQALYQTELTALKKVVPSGAGLEIGVGTGRFAAPLGVRFGLDPAIHMLQLAKKRGLLVVQGLGESLPFKDESFDFIQIIFVIEFVDDLVSFLREAVRTVRRNGALILGFIDRDSLWGQYYARDPAQRRNFHPPSAEEAVRILNKVGLEFREARQTLFQCPPDLSKKENAKPGFGQGGFVVLLAAKKQG
jgi:ubiquinone/menaquinone biosynthesis C-methylase UbiE